MTPETLVAPIARWRRSPLLRLAAIVVMIALLHIPLALTHGVLRERQKYQAQATGEISRLWGGEQRITGPVLQVPYFYRGLAHRNKQVNGQWQQVDEPALLSGFAYFLPERLKVEGVVNPEIRHRGIYDAVVYAAELKLRGVWTPDFAAAGIEAERVAWDKARVLFGVSDLHGLRMIAWEGDATPGGTEFETVDGTTDALLPLAANVRTVAVGGPTEFAITVSVQGTSAITVVPVGKQTDITLRSDWPAPSFVGAWSPMRRAIDAQGFSADWQLSHFGRGVPQSWTQGQISVADVTRKFEAASLGVRFGRGIDGYAMVERAQKYGLLFFVLMFAVFFLFEVTAGLRIHPLQYAMVGAASCLFFLMFLALSEFWAIGLAYAVAAAACTVLVALYSWTFLQSGARTTIVFGGLAATYAYLFFVLQSQDYALLAGSLALFAALALTMFFTRRVNWYELDNRGLAAE